MRLTSLDVFRGIAIAGMILVNKAGVADQVYPFLEHAKWHGCTPTDLVFPFFLFIVGVAMIFSLSKYNEENRPTAAVYRRIFRRVVILFVLGLLLNGFWTYNWDTIRIMGVLQRISLAYLFATLIVINVPRKGQWAIALLLLIGYWVAMSLIPVPDYGAGNLSSPEGNFASYIDRLIIGTKHLHPGDAFKTMGDPEGLFSTLPAIVTVLIGYFTGDWLRLQPVQRRTSIGLVLFGIGCLGVGWAWGLVFPINKRLWTSSYVLFSSGWALLLLAACYELIEVRNRRWGKPFEVMGLNAIFVFVASVLLIKILVKTKIGTGENAPSIYTWIYEHLFLPWASPMNASLVFAVLTLLFWWAICYAMYRQRWFVKI